ncbi:HAD family hydrolase [Lactococcus formosensis]|uniref:HAD family hydrolase n=1 Tax=Lactococcus formosensis TaxID=1281486 RepID=UPI0022E2EED6|nr:HAD family hydrolase [Lactococcus formosensis]
MEEIKNIIFDWDNTLFPFKKYWEIAHRKVFLDLIDFQDGFSIDDFMAKYRELDEQLWPLVHEGKMTIAQLREERVRQVLDYYAIHYKENFVRLFFDIFLTALLEEIEVDHDLLTKIKELSQNYNIAILSNGESWEQREKIKRFGFENLFPVYISAETGFVKPDQAAFRNILEKENFERKATLMVGDLVEHDILPAQELGLATAYIGYNDSKIADENYKSIQSFLEDFLK